jgi:hypothetical protein
MAVPQLVNLFEAIERPVTPPQDRGRLPSRIRLQLQTMFHHPRPRISNTASSTPISSAQSSPTPSYRRYKPRAQSPTSDLMSLFTPSSATSSPSSYTRTHIRRQPSAIDLALEAERYAVGPENIGLGLFEPRPRAPSSSSSAGSQCSIMEFMNESNSAPVVLDGIAEVMEGA